MIESPIPRAFLDGRVQDTLLFTYDVYMSIVRLHRYVPSARMPKVLKLPNYKLTFPKYFEPASSGLPSIVHSVGDSVWGIGWRANVSELKKFEKKLFVPDRYHMRKVRLVEKSGDSLPGITYAITLHDDEPSKPSKSKIEEIIEVGRKVSLPDDYLEELAKYDTLRA